MPNSLLTSGIAIGGAAAIIAALLWAIATVIFHTLGEKIHPTELNLVKCTFAVILMILTTLLLRESLPDAGWLPYALLAVSGIVGIGIGDTAYFAALNQLGSRITLLLTVLAPPMAGVLSWLFLGETLAPHRLVGDLRHDGRDRLGNLARKPGPGFSKSLTRTRNFLRADCQSGAGGRGDPLALCPHLHLDLRPANRHHPLTRRDPLVGSGGILFP